MASPALATTDESSSLTSATTKNDLSPVVAPLSPCKLPSQRQEITVVAPVTIQPTVQSVEGREVVKATAVVNTRGPRKSVSIFLPDEENG